MRLIFLLLCPLFLAAQTPNELNEQALDLLGVDYDSVRSLATLAYTIATDQGDDFQAGRAKFFVAYSYEKQGYISSAAIEYLEALRMLEGLEERDWRKEARILKNLGKLSRIAGQHEMAHTYYDQALEPAEKDSDAELASVWYNKGFAYMKSLEFLKSIDSYNNSLKLAEKLEDHVKMANIYNYIGVSYRQLKEYDLARVYYQKVIDMKDKLGDGKKFTVGQAYHNIANTYFEQGEFDLAEENFLMTLAIQKKEESFITYMDLGELYLRQGKMEAAQNRFQQAMASVPSAMQPEHYRIYSLLKEVSQNDFQDYKRYDSLYMASEASYRSTQDSLFDLGQKYQYAQAITAYNRDRYLRQQLDKLWTGIKVGLPLLLLVLGIMYLIREELRRVRIRKIKAEAEAKIEQRTSQI